MSWSYMYVCMYEVHMLNIGTYVINNTGQQNLTFFFGTRGKISNPNRTFNAEFKCVSSFSPSPTVCL